MQKSNRTGITPPHGTNVLTVGEAVVAYLERRGVLVIFGIPGVHTVELYRGLGNSSIRHVTPRHEQGAGFMADGFARASGKPGVAFVITGPGMTNILTAMGQARADSIPMLVISSVNEAKYLGKDLGHLHEMPDQHSLCAQIALRSEHVEKADELIPALDRIFEALETGRPGPMHLQVPLDVFAQTFGTLDVAVIEKPATLHDADAISRAAELLKQARRPLILAGGGSQQATECLAKLANLLNAPVVQTINARGIMHGHPLRIPASPSLGAVKNLIAKSDTILAIGTQLGPTDFDIYNAGTIAELNNLIRIDVDQTQLEKHPADVAIHGSAEVVLPILADALQNLQPPEDWGQQTAARVRQEAFAELSPDYQHMVTMVEAIRDSVPNSIIVGDSTQPIYAANLFYGHDSESGWFNSSVGFGTLGYAIPAAIGASLGAPGRRVVCITGDGGAQFTLPELRVAVDENLPITFIVWNNSGYKQIANAMVAAGNQVIGCSPTPPDFELIAKANGLNYLNCDNNPEALTLALRKNNRFEQSTLIEITAP